VYKDIRIRKYLRRVETLVYGSKDSKRDVKERTLLICVPPLDIGADGASILGKIGLVYRARRRALVYSTGLGTTSA